MTRPVPSWRCRPCWAGALLLALLLCPPVRQLLEARMSLHMLVQFPALMLAGALLATAAPARLRRMGAAWNAMGIGGLAAAALVLAVAMIPRLLDLALVDWRIQAAKVAALLLCGAVLWPSWRAAGWVVQGFFLGNVLAMTGIVGLLYQDTPIRLCNAYRLDDQQHLGQGLVALAIGLALWWLLRVGRRLAADAPPDTGPAAQSSSGAMPGNSTSV
ncbi:MAG: hypothetical protein MK041_05520 [Aquabacterium sp.]|nr:hypothetical protein [Aquabacterium sp.]